MIRNDILLQYTGYYINQSETPNAKGMIKLELYKPNGNNWGPILKVVLFKQDNYTSEQKAINKLKDFISYQNGNS